MKTRFLLPMLTLPLLIGAALGYGITEYRSSSRARQNPPAFAARDPASLSSSELTAPSQTRQLKTILSQSTEREALLWLRKQWGVFASADYAAAATEVIASGAGRHEPIFNELFQAWGEVAPLDAIAFAGKLRGNLKKRACLAIFEGWGQADPDALLAWYETQREDPFFGKLKADLIECLAAKRPEEAFKLFSEESYSLRLRHGGSSFFSHLAQVDPGKALEFFNRLPETERDKHLSLLLTGWCSTDPDGAMAWIASQPKGPLREKGMQTMVGQLSLFSPREATELAMKELTSSNTSRVGAFMVVKMWCATDPEEAERYVSQQPPSPFRDEALKIIESEWASLHPLEYLNHKVESGDFSKQNNMALLAATTEILLKNPEAYGKWLTENSRNLPPQQLTQLISRAAFANPELSSKLLSLLPEGAQTDSTYRSLGLAWAQKDMEEARRFLETLPPGTARDSYQRALIGQLANANVTLALKEAEAITDPTTQKQVFGDIARNARNLAELTEWVQKQPLGNNTIAYYQDITRSWVTQDAAATATWIGKMPEGASKQGSIQTYASEIATTDPKTAIQWAQRLKDEKAKEQTLTSVVSRWMQADKAAASQWLKESSLPEKTKKRYLKD